MKCFVTGASGFIGANLVHELVAQGHQVRCLLRRGCDLRGLENVSYETTDGDLTDYGSLLAGIRGCDWCFHVAASYHLWLKDYAPMYAANVGGTSNVIKAAMSAQCSRIIYTSTVGCIGLPKPGTISPIPSDENTPFSTSQLSNDYKKSKWEAEQVALELVRKGAPIVIVNPSTPVGPRDVKPTPTGKIIVDFLNGQMPAYLDTGLNWVHVRDVVKGHILAAQKGRIGERYILGHCEGNWTMKKTFEILSEITGQPAPRFQIPYSVAWMAAYVNEFISKMTGHPPRAPMAGVRMARYKMFFNPNKAIQELGIPQTPPRQAMIEAIDWFKNGGYIQNRV